MADVPPLDLYGSGYEPPLCLWKLVEQHVPEHERDEVKNILGESLIDQSLELHEEVNTLLDIWRDYREETDLEIAQPTRLPEPPELRERLVREISFFATTIKEKARNQGIDPEKILSRHNSEIIEYAQETSLPSTERPYSRQHTSRSKEGLETPRISTPDRKSVNSTISDGVESVTDKLNMMHFDEVTENLRCTLQEEVNLLLDDINFLQQCLEDEASFRAGGGPTLTREPTLTELKEERTSLEKELFSNECPIPAKPAGKKPAFTPSRLRHIPKTPTHGCKLRPTSQSSSATSKTPLKASHELRPVVPSVPAEGEQPAFPLFSPDGKERKDLASPSGSISSITSQVSLRDIALCDRHPANRKRTISPSRVKVVPVGSIIEPVTRDSASSTSLTPSPPSTGRRTDRLSSAERFRTMVLKNREQPA